MPATEIRVSVTGAENACSSSWGAVVVQGFKSSLPAARLLACRSKAGTSFNGNWRMGPMLEVSRQLGDLALVRSFMKGRAQPLASCSSSCYVCLPVANWSLFSDTYKETADCNVLFTCSSAGIIQYVQPYATHDAFQLLYHAFHSFLLCLNIFSLHFTLGCSVILSAPILKTVPIGLALFQP